MAETITQHQVDSIFPTVAKTIADALACEIDQVTPSASLIDDLGAESIDFLDLVFRLERAFAVKIPRGKIIEDARGDLAEAAFEQRGVVTDAGLVRLRQFLSEVPGDRFKTPLKTTDIPRLFTAETFAKLVLRAQAGRGAAA